MTNAPFTMSRERLETILDGFSKLTIGLVGDLFLDRYLEIETGNTGNKEHSLETGLEAYQICRVQNQPGALGTVMNNLATLGVGLLRPVTVVGEDGHAFDLLKSMQSLPVDACSVIQRPERLTPTYTKPHRQNERGSIEELNRLDFRSRSELVGEATQLVIQGLKSLFQETDGIIVLDQINETNWGVVNADVRDALNHLCEQYPEKLVAVDSRTHLHEFRWGILKGNESEWRAVASGHGDDDLESVLNRIHEATGRPVYCTMGEDGMFVTADTGRTTHVPGFPVEGPVDIVGAGDSVTSGIVASLLSGADPIEAAILSNLVASITVHKLGTTGTATPDEVLNRYQELL